MSTNGSKESKGLDQPAVRFVRRLIAVSGLVCFHLALVFLTSCAPKPIDPRTLVPADSLVYLETKDLGKMMNAVVSRASFEKLAKTTPNTAALNGIRLSVAITGFQTSEEAASDGSAVLNFRPHFVAVAETNAWNYQALSFTENKLGEFVNDIYGGEVEMVTADKHGGKYFIWTGKDGRKAYALVRGSVIFFGNDESSIDKCVSVANGEAESVAGTAAASRFLDNSLASGFVSTDGIAQIGNVAGISLAKLSSEEGEVQSFIARVLPQLIRNSATGITWNAQDAEVGIEDRVTIDLKPEISKGLSGTIVRADQPGPSLTVFLPGGLASATRYVVKDPPGAFDLVLDTVEKQTDPLSGKLLVGFSSSLFEPYGIEVPELFLRSIDSEIITVQFDPDGDKAVVIAAVKDPAKLKKSLARELNFSAPPSQVDGAAFWRSNDGEIGAAFVDNMVVLGDAEGVAACLKARINYEKPGYPLDAGPDAVSVSWTSDAEQAGRIVEAISDKKPNGAGINSPSITQTRFTEDGIERLTFSDFGLIGSIIANLRSE